MPFRAVPSISQKIPRMSLRQPFAYLVLATLALGAARSAHAVCTARQIIGPEPNCSPGVVACTIAGDYTIDNGCTLDFGNQQVTLAATSRLTIGSRMATIRAARLTVSGIIDAIGGGTAARGGMVVIETTGNFTVTTDGTIDASGNANGGEIIVRAGGAVSIVGKIRSDDLTRAAGGGLIDITAAGNLVNNGTISATGGNDSDGGGEIDLAAGGNLTLTTDLDVSGLDGGFIDLRAGGTVAMRGVAASGAGDAGSGGCIDITAGAGVTVSGNMISNGASGTFMTGGCGGLICIDGGFGNVTVPSGAIISSDGASPDGGGGTITLVARGSTIINGSVTARGPTGETCGGCLCVETGLDVTIGSAALVDVSAGDSGGGATLMGGRNIVINGPIDASSQRPGSLGGEVTVRAGWLGSGDLTANSTMDVSTSGSCSDQNGCGEGGTNDLMGCNVTIGATASLIATAPDGGENDLTARELLTIHGVLDATRTVATGMQGMNRSVFPLRRPPNTQGATIMPAGSASPLTTCPNQANTVPPCLTPCPVCGDGMISFPETCDKGMIPPKSCSGCSIYCQLESCDDGLVCTTDSCDLNFGCSNTVIPDCTEPTPTVTGTPPTRTATVTATPTLTATATRTASGTPSVTKTPMSTPTRSESPTPSVTPTVPASATSSVTATAPATFSSTATATGTATNSAPPTETATTPPACAGDCNGSGDVAVNELIAGVNIALGNNSVDSCRAFDTNHDGSVSIAELIAAVNIALSHC